MFRTVLPFILIGLAIFSAWCIAYIAWELTSEKQHRPPRRDGEEEAAGD